MSVPFISNNKKITVVLKGQTYTVDNNNAKFVDIVNSIKEGKAEDEIYKLITHNIDMAEYIASQGNARLTIVNGKVYIDGEELHNSITERIVDFKNNNLPIDHLVNFVERAAKNPSFNSRNQLYSFLAHKDLVITEDGHFLAYKAVLSDYLDKYSRTIDNHPGQTVRMDRNKIDDNPNNHCSKGLHVGAMGYVQWYGHGSDKVVIVKVDPANVVSVPGDSSCQKCRVCEYTVLRDSEGVMTQPLYTTTGEPYKPEEYTGGWGFADDAVEDEFDDGEVYSYDDEEEYEENYSYEDDDVEVSDSELEAIEEEEIEAEEKRTDDRLLKSLLNFLRRNKDDDLPPIINL